MLLNIILQVVESNSWIGALVTAGIIGVDFFSHINLQVKTYTFGQDPP